MSMHHVYTYVCTHICTHVCTHVYTHVYAHVYRHAYAHVYTHICTHVYTHVYTHVHAHVHTQGPVKAWAPERTDPRQSSIATCRVRSLVEERKREHSLDFNALIDQRPLDEVP